MRPDRGRWPTPDTPGRYAQALGLAIEAARAAGARLRAERHHPGELRGDGIEHAEIDTEVEAEEIRPRLSAAFPQWGYRGEETRPHLPPADDAGHVWLVDPNDGTAAYMRGYRGPAVSIGLLRDGLPVLGVVYAYDYPDDAGDLIAWAEGEPLTRNGAVLDHALAERPLRRADRVLVSQAADRAPLANAAGCAPARYLAIPSIAYRLALVAAGDGVAAVGLSGPGDWDYCAGHALLRPVGGELVGGDGWPVLYTREGVSRAEMGRCFGGPPAVLETLWQQDWDAVRREAAPEVPYPLVRPSWGGLASDSAALARAQGCLFGQLVGDALGSQVEFASARSIQGQFPDGVRVMTGGGPWDTLAGQPTDDSELAFMLARSIREAGGYDPNAAARAYGYWLRSNPFDVGATTKRALSAAGEGPDAAERTLRAANPESQANGSLMRVSPLAIWGHRLLAERLDALAREDSSITHPNAVCQDAVAVYAVAIARAIRQGLSPRETYQTALDWSKQHTGSELIRDALREAAEPAERQPHIDGPRQGWVVFALQNAFHQLLHAPSVEEGIVRTVGLGGDTDTNACIAGALLGAVYGRAAIPRAWQLAVLSCRPLARFGARRVRPQPFWPVDALALAETLLVLGAHAADARDAGIT